MAPQMLDTSIRRAILLASGNGFIHSMTIAPLSGNLLLRECSFFHLRSNALRKVEETPSIQAENLLLVGFGQAHFVQHLKCRLGLPARIVIAEHDVIDAKEFDRP